MMKLTEEQQAILDGAQGEVLAKVMKTMVMYGETFGAEKMVPVTSEYNHLVTSFGLKMLGPVYELMDKLIEAGAVSQQKFSVDPRPVDKNVPANFLQNLIFNKIMYSKQDFYEEQLNKLGLMEKDAFTCACYLDEVGILFDNDCRGAKGCVANRAALCSKFVRNGGCSDVRICGSKK